MYLRLPAGEHSQDHAGNEFFQLAWNLSTESEISRGIGKSFRNHRYICPLSHATIEL